MMIGEMEMERKEREGKPGVLSNMKLPYSGLQALEHV